MSLQMDTLYGLFAQHAILTLFVLVMVKQLGAPLPVWPLLLLAGAMAADSAVFAVEAFAAATTASVLADSAWYLAGRRLGRKVLALLCRLSIYPDTCVRKNELSFQRRGASTLVLAKFIPGLGTIAPPLAGALGFGWRRFAGFTALGSAVWVATGMVSGLVLHDQVAQVLAWLGALGQVAPGLLLAGLILFVAWRVWLRHRHRRSGAALPRVSPEELAAMLLQAGPDPLILDVRSPSSQGGIPGARHFDLGDTEGFVRAGWPAGSPVVTYCDCPNDASATKAALLLNQRGIDARVLRGGLDAWTQAGYGVVDHGRAGPVRPAYGVAAHESS